MGYEIKPNISDYCYCYWNISLSFLLFLLWLQTSMECTLVSIVDFPPISIDNCLLNRVSNIDQPCNHGNPEMHTNLSKQY